jgi:cell division transport system permease protein
VPLKFGYFAREAASNLRRNLLMTVAGTLTATVALLLLGGVLTLGDFVQGITGQIERKVEVSVFLKDEITAEQQKDIQQTIESLSVVRSVGYVSKEDAFKEFKQLYRDQPVLWENIDASVLPASFRVSMRNPKRVDVIKSKLEGNPAVEEVADQQATVQRLVRFTGILRTFSGVMVLILFVAAVLLIANTIQLAIFARRREINIMQLVGATNWFIRVPFMLEGVVAGVVGAVVALALLYVGKLVGRTMLPVWIPTGPLHGVDVGQLLTLVLLGVGLGAIGSAVALRRFLREA